jgi:zinc D-Ala-D-Ala dipeptidase
MGKSFGRDGRDLEDRKARRVTAGVPVFRRLRLRPVIPIPQIPSILSRTFPPFAPLRLCVSLLLVIAAQAEAAPLVDVRSVDPSIVVELRYNTTDNVFGKRFYNSNVAMLRKPVAERLARVQARLRKQGLGLKVWDAYRPHSVQYALWKIKPGTGYLANPRRGSRHNRGAAVDLTLVDRDGNELKMPTPYDEFSPRAHRGATRGVTPLAQKNARILDAAMRAEGFLPNRREWWHFDDPNWRSYPLTDIPLPPDRPAGRG